MLCTDIVLSILQYGSITAKCPGPLMKAEGRSCLVSFDTPSGAWYTVYPLNVEAFIIINFKWGYFNSIKYKINLNASF